MLLRFVKTLGTRNREENLVRWTSNVKPSLGGLTFFIIFLLSLGGHSLIFPGSGSFIDIKTIGKIGTVILAFIIGLADDAYDTRPWLKFFGQITCGIILVLTGTVINVFEYHFLDAALTVIWVVGLMNSINMLDNMDAITAVTSLGILVSSFIAAWFTLTPEQPDYLLIIGTAAAVCGFLFYNWHPSRIYMGDTGSQFLGALLGIFGIDFFWNNQVELNVEMPLASAIMALLVFILPITDTTTVTINRLLKRQSPFIGGRDHTTHHLSYQGLSDSQVAILFIFISACSSLLFWMTLKFQNSWGIVTYIIDAIFCLLVFASLYLITKSGREIKK